MRNRTFFILLIVFVLLLFSYSFIFYPAYISLKVDCNKISSEELADKGIYISGVYNKNTDTIVIYLDEGETEVDRSSLRHESVHKVQARNNRLNNCDKKFLLFLDEVEAYSMSYLPDFIFYKIYNF